MGQIVLWTAGVELSTSSVAISSPPPVCVSNTLSGHKGIIWKVRWNTAKDRIVSVSDDRTVRVWDVASGEELFCGFGHICRVWDAMFVGKGDKAVVTCGEDAVVKLWDVESQKCVMTMQGHANKHIWCVNMLQITNNCTMDSVLLSGGNDCCVNLWPVSVHTLLNAEPQIICQKEASTSGFRPQVSTQEQLCARWQAQLGLSQGLLDTTSKYSHMLPHWDSSPEMVDSLHSKPFQTVIAHRMSSCGSLSILITQKSIWMIDLESNDMQDVRDEINGIENVKQEIGHDKGWNRILCTDKQINAADAVFVTNGLGDWSMDCCCVHPEGYVTLASWQYSSATNVGQEKERSISSLKLMEWKGHQRNSMNVSFLPTGCGPGDKYGEVTCAHNAASLFLTMSVQGECKIWKKQLQDDELMISQELECRTAKCNIATSAALLCESKCVAIGDCRGNVSLFRYETEPTSSESSSVAIGQGLSVPPFKDTPCFQFIPKAHGLEIVSCIQAVRGGFCSLGYDGYLSVFSFNPQDPPHCFYLASRLPCTPIASPDQMFCTYDRGAEDNWSLIVAGYQASDFIIYDIRKKYQLLKISAGGWKRAHRAALNFCDSSNHGFPDVAFIYSAMIETRAVYNCMRYKVKTLVTEHGPVIDSSRLPMQLGSPSLGKVAYCATFLSGTAVSDSVITQPFLAVGAEDGTVKVFSYYNESDVSELSSSPPKSTYYRFEQEVQMPSNVAARAIFHCRPRDCPSSDGILIAAGGRLMFSIWRYRKPDINSSSPLGCVLEQVYASNSESCRRVNKGKKGKSEKSNSAGGDIHSDVQDHRILATAALPLAGGSGYVIMFCDSRGMVKVIRLAEQQNLRKSGGIKDGSDELIIGSGMGFNVTDEIEFTASSYPLLSCVLLSFGHEISTFSSKDDDFHLGIVGNTHGGVSVWVLSTSTFNNRPICSSDQEVFSYEGHTMGTNSLTCVKNEALNLNDSEGISCSFTVCSGADDQSITVGKFSMTISKKENKPVQILVNVISIQRILGASGSAIKGVRLFPSLSEGGSLLLASVGYDQRLSIWKLSDDNENIVDPIVPLKDVSIPCQVQVSTNANALSIKRKLCNDENIADIHVPPSTSMDVEDEGAEFPIASPIRFTSDHISIFSQPIKESTYEFSYGPLHWLGGSIVNVGDVNGMAVLQTDKGDNLLAVVGEGFQVFRNL